MARFYKKQDQRKGLGPGSLQFVGTKKEENVRIRLIDYDSENLHEDTLQDIARSASCLETNNVSWINIDGLHDTDLMKNVGSLFRIHPLLIEDIMNTGHRPKVQESENCLFIVLKMLRYDSDEQLIIAEQLSIILGPNYLLTFQEQKGDVFDPVRDRIRKMKGRIRGAGPDYLAYALMDIVVDNYISIIERMGDQIEDLEEKVLADPTTALMNMINDFKREMNFLRKSIRPVKELINQLGKIESPLIQADTMPFIKDLEDHITQASEAIDTYREMLSDHLNIYNSSISNRMNEIMKVLTIFAAIFIPLTFIAGIYGTNFEYVPEIHFRYSYFIFLGVMIVIAGTMIGFFRKKGWL